MHFFHAFIIIEKKPDDKYKNREFVEKLFSKFSQIKVVDSPMDLEIATIAASCMPAFIALSLDLFAGELEEKCNLSKEETFKILAETLNSTAYILK